MKKIAKLFVYLEFYGSDLNKNMIYEIFGKEDIFISLKGDEYFIFKDGNKNKEIRQNDYCNISYEKCQYENKSLSDILIHLLKEQCNKIEIIEDLHKHICKKIHICIYPEENQYNIAVSKELMCMLLNLNMEMEMTVLKF